MAFAQYRSTLNIFGLVRFVFCLNRRMLTQNVVIKCLLLRSFGVKAHLTNLAFWGILLANVHRYSTYL